jgi:hypothetical protein
MPHQFNGPVRNVMGFIGGCQTSQFIDVITPKAEYLREHDDVKMHAFKRRQKDGLADLLR